MKQVFTLVLALLMTSVAQAKNVTITVKDTKYQTITGFGAACCDGAMCPYGTDTQPVKLLYGNTSKIGLNIMRMEISPNFKGDITASDVGWDTPYDWNGSLPSAKIVKQRGGIVFGTPWSPPGEYKTNGSAAGGNSDDQGNIRAELREDCYEKFFPWLNSFLKWMKQKGVKVDAVSIQNEPDWWVSYSGCLYTPQQQVNLVKNYAHMLDRETYPWVRLISAEPLGFTSNYSDALMNNKTARDQIDIVAGHIYGHAPLQEGNLKTAAVKAKQYNKEVWMTEHSVSDGIQNRLPTWHEQLLFAEELNECMQAGCTAYIYWYMRAHWAFVGTGETKYGTANKKNVLLPRAYVYSHFAKNVTGSTRIVSNASGYSQGTEQKFETTAYIKGDSIIVMAIDTVPTATKLTIKLPYLVKSGTHLLSTGNDTKELCQKTDLVIDEPTKQIVVETPGCCLSTFVFMRYHEEDGIDTPSIADESTSASRYFDLQGRRTDDPKGLYIKQDERGKARKVTKRK